MHKKNVHGIVKFPLSMTIHCEISQNQAINLVSVYKGQHGDYCQI